MSYSSWTVKKILRWIIGIVILLVLGAFYYFDMSSNYMVALIRYV